MRQDCRKLRSHRAESTSRDTNLAIEERTRPTRSLRYVKVDLIGVQNHGNCGRWLGREVNGELAINGLQRRQDLLPKLIVRDLPIVSQDEMGTLQHTQFAVNS